jgi:hypothetical protein
MESLFSYEFYENYEGLEFFSLDQYCFSRALCVVCEEKKMGGRGAAAHDVSWQEAEWHKLVGFKKAGTARAQASGLLQRQPFTLFFFITFIFLIIFFLSFFTIQKKKS